MSAHKLVLKAAILYAAYVVLRAMFRVMGGTTLQWIIEARREKGANQERLESVADRIVATLQAIQTRKRQHWTDHDDPELWHDVALR